mgnify:CR=1 FL=1|jgi:rubrerythrin
MITNTRVTQLLGTVLKIEKAMELKYTHLSEEIHDARYKKILTRLLKEEKIHQNIIDSLIEILSQ